MNFDVVFNHTTLEHVFDIFKAVKNLCELSRDVVIVVVPFVQETHTASSFSDYGRFTHFGLERLFKENSFEVIYLTSTPYTHTSIYHFFKESFRHCQGDLSQFKDKWFNN